MFESNDDIDVDDDFLNGVFESEEQESLISFPPKSESIHADVHRLQQNFAVSTNRTILPHETIEHESVVTRRSNFCATPNQEHCTGAASTHNDNKRKHPSPPVPSKSKRERKFPGPAGLLPDRKSSRITPVKLDSLLELDQSPQNTTTDDLCSQGRCSGSVLEEEPWQNFLKDLGPDRDILELVNVASVKRKAAARCFVGKKLPFLAAVLHHMDVSSPDPCIILRDTTGEIHGTLHREVWEQFAGELTVGSVLVMRNVGLLSTGISSRRHYLNITAKNLATIYSANSENSRNTRLHHFTRQDFAQTIDNWRSLVSPSHGVGSPVSARTPTLFNTSLSSSPVSSPRTPGVHPGRSLNMRSEVDQRLRSMSRDNNRPTSDTPLQSPRISGPTRGRNLIPSFVPQGSPNIVRNSLQNCSKFLGSVNHTNSSQSTTKTSPYITSNVINNQIHNPDCDQSVQTPNSPSDNFKFDPVIVTPKRSISIFSPNNTKDSKNTVTNITVPDRALGNSNGKIVLSQSSQLTADEEQSMVESVFDGIDVDSLFTDDF